MLLRALEARKITPVGSHAEVPSDVRLIAELMQHFTRTYLTEPVQRTGGNQSQAARLSGLERTYIGRLIARLGLRDG